MENQLAAIKKLREFGITVKINTIVIPGTNDHLVESIAEKAKELGAELMNAIPLFPVADTPYENLKEPDILTMRELRLKIAKHLKPEDMLHKKTRKNTQMKGWVGAILGG